MSSEQPLVNLSLSPTPEAARLGYDNRQFNRLTVRMAHHFLTQGYRVLFGHDWREDGVMRAVADHAETLAETGRDSGTPLMINIVPTPTVSAIARQAAEQSQGILEVLTLEEACKDTPFLPVIDYINGNASHPHTTSRRLSLLRVLLTERLGTTGTRVCVGGKLEGYTGFMPGVLEEMGCAIANDTPLIVHTGFGGASALVDAPDAEHQRIIERIEREWFESRYRVDNEEFIERLHDACRYPWYPMFGPPFWFEGNFRERKNHQRIHRFRPLDMDGFLDFAVRIMAGHAATADSP